MYPAILSAREQRRYAALNAVAPLLGLQLTPELAGVVVPRPRLKGISGGVRAGKSTAHALDIFVETWFAEQDRDYLYWLILPSFKTEPKELQYLAAWARAVGTLGKQHWRNEDTCRVEMLGGQVAVETKTAQDPEGIASDAVDGVVLTEAGQVSEAVYAQAQGRVLDRDGWIDIGGTLEDDEARPRWAWFGQKITDWLENPDADHRAFRLPSWANPSVFPLGEADPKVALRRAELGEHRFRRMMAGEPAGTPYPIYPVLEDARDEDWQYRGMGRWIASWGVGGHDFGTTSGHPSTLVAVTVDNARVAVVREALVFQGADQSFIETQRRLLGQKYGIPSWRWGFDPVQREAAKIVGAFATAAGKGSRFARVGHVEGRLNNRTLLFDFAGKGVKDVFRQMQRVHYVRRLVAGQGEVDDYARVDDDLAAAVEDACEVLAAKLIMPRLAPARLLLPPRRPVLAGV